MASSALAVLKAAPQNGPQPPPSIRSFADRCPSVSVCRGVPCSKPAFRRCFLCFSFCRCPNDASAAPACAGALNPVVVFAILCCRCSLCHGAFPAPAIKFPCICSFLPCGQPLLRVCDPHLYRGVRCRRSCGTAHAPAFRQHGTHGGHGSGRAARRGAA